MVKISRAGSKGLGADGCWVKVVIHLNEYDMIYDDNDENDDDDNDNNDDDDDDATNQSVNDAWQLGLDEEITGGLNR